MHFSTNTRTHTHSYTLLYALFHPHEKSRKHSEDDDRNNVTDQVLHCGGSDLSRDWVYYSGWILYEGEKAPQLTVFENKMARHHRDMPSLLLFSFFFSNTKNKKYVDSQVWLKTCEWQVLIGRFGSAPLPSRILSSFFFLFFFLVFFFFLTHTHTRKICGG